MIADLTDVPVDDAERLEHAWGIQIAMDMLHDALITPAEFLWLCDEAATAEPIGGGVGHVALSAL
jgi:hypothetical protein